MSWRHKPQEMRTLPSNVLLQPQIRRVYNWYGAAISPLARLDPWPGFHRCSARYLLTFQQFIECGRTPIDVS
jgi:hypothetical protein